ncbi:MAG: response regulator [Acidobacteriota bacterium]
MILLVEDDDLVRELLMGFLEAAGYAVLEAASAEHALRAIAARPAALDLVITDMALPGLDGAELVRQLVATRPGLKVLYMSGNPVDPAGGAAGCDGAASLGKPFTRDAFMATVRGLLAQRG